MKNWIASALAILALAGCTARTPQNLGHVEIQGGGPTPTASAQIGSSTAAESTASANDATAFGERYDPDSEHIIGDETLKAWRVAVKHAKRDGMSESEWKAQRVKDEEDSMRMLNDLSERYPRSSTVRFMMGQVKEHFGKHEEAAKHYSESTLNNRQNGIYMFKLAEAENKAGQLDKAIAHYRLILEHNKGDIYQRACQLGLARALLKKDANSTEAKELLQSVLKAEPENPEAKLLLQGAK